MNVETKRTLLEVIELQLDLAVSTLATILSEGPEVHRDAALDVGREVAKVRNLVKRHREEVEASDPD